MTGSEKAMESGWNGFSPQATLIRMSAERTGRGIAGRKASLTEDLQAWKGWGGSDVEDAAFHLIRPVSAKARVEQPPGRELEGREKARRRPPATLKPGERLPVPAKCLIIGRMHAQIPLSPLCVR